MLLLVSAWNSLGHSQTIELPRAVPSFNQAFFDGPGAWGHCPLGTVGCPDLIGTTGCLVTAFASVLAYYKIDLTVPARSSCTGVARSGMDPGIFNDWLREVGGFGRCAQDPVGNCCLIWDKLPEELEITTHVNRSADGLNPVTSVVIDHALRRGYPVIAGVHWGAFCNGVSGQTRDCHWIIITGKRDGVYTIIDPFNPDRTSPYGVKTTLARGVMGSYIINRYVVVAGPHPSDVNPQIGIAPHGASYQVGEQIRLTLNVPGSSAAWLPYARVTLPSGLVAYAILNEAGSVRYSAIRVSLIPQPRALMSAWNWYNRTLTESDIGRWQWEIWLERADDPGEILGLQTITYHVQPVAAASYSSGVVVVLGIMLLAAVAVIALLFASGIELK